MCVRTLMRGDPPPPYATLHIGCDPLPRIEGRQTFVQDLVAAAKESIFFNKKKSNLSFLCPDKLFSEFYILKTGKIKHRTSATVLQLQNIQRDLQSEIIRGESLFAKGVIIC